jgi:hypothetical protein
MYAPKTPDNACNEQRLCSIFPDGLEVEISAPLCAADTPPLPGVPLAEAKGAAAIGHVQARSPRVAAVFAVGGSLETGDALSLNGLFFCVGAVFNGLERRDRGAAGSH